MKNCHPEWALVCGSCTLRHIPSEQGLWPRIEVDKDSLKRTTEPFLIKGEVVIPGWDKSDRELYLSVYNHAKPFETRPNEAASYAVYWVILKRNRAREKQKVEAAQKEFEANPPEESAETSETPVAKRRKKRDNSQASIF